MNRPRLGVRPHPSERPKIIEGAILLGCLAIGAMLLWRAVSGPLGALLTPKRQQVVVLDSQDDCLGGLCANAKAAENK